MLNIVTKSIQLRRNKSDGVRICIMRRIRSEYDFDMWLPKLSPTEKLLENYVINKKINWRKFSSEFKEKVINKNQSIIDMIVILSKLNKITLLCWEKKPTHCHRRLVLEACKRRNPYLKTSLE